MALIIQKANGSFTVYPFLNLNDFNSNWSEKPVVGPFKENIPHKIVAFAHASHMSLFVIFFCKPVSFTSFSER